MDRKELTSLLPPGVVEPDRLLLRSVEREGILVPLITNGGVVVDGLKRLKAAESVEVEDLPVLDVEGDPFRLRWVLNGTRSWSLVETATVFEGLPESERRDFALSLNLGSSPFLPEIMAVLAAETDLHAPVDEGRLSLAVLRDLRYLGESMVPWASFLASKKGTAGERRVAATLLKACALRGERPDPPDLSTVGEVIRLLTPMARPDTSNAAAAFDRAVGDLDLPPGTALAIDTTLEREGVEVKVWVTRRDVERLDRVKNEIIRLFALLDVL